MVEIIEQPIKVYIKVNATNEIIDINSSVFIKDTLDWFIIDSGFGDKYAHAQSQYLDKGLADEEGNYNYKYENNEIIYVGE